MVNPAMPNNRKKNLLFLLPRLYPCATGGIEIFHHYFVKAISAWYNVFVCTQCDKLSGNGIFIHHYENGSFFGSSTLTSWKETLTTIYRLRDTIDLIHLPYSSKAVIQDYYLPVIAKLYHIPFIIRIHGGGMHPSRPFFLHQTLFSRAAGIIAVSEPIREEYENRHGKAIRHIPSMLPYLQSDKPAEELKCQHGLNANDFVILFVGSLKEIKGPEILLEAFNRLGSELINRHRLKLVYAGDGPMRARLQEQAEQLNIPSNVLFAGFVPHEKICECYKMADIFIIPSLMEARPLALSEALHNGVPSIASAIPTLESIIDDRKNGLLFRPQDPEHMADKLRMLIEDHELRLQLGSTARLKYRQEYRFEQMLDEYRVFYDAVINLSLSPQSPRELNSAGINGQNAH